MSDTSSKIYFSVAEANAMIGDLERAFGRMLQMKAQLREVYTRLEEVGYAPARDEFDHFPDDAPSGVINDLSTLRTLIDAITAEVGALDEAGCMVKDIDEGIADWRARKGGREVLLCWKLGEKEVAHWHEIDAGFTGRRPVSELEAD